MNIQPNIKNTGIVFFSDCIFHALPIVVYHHVLPFRNLCYSYIKCTRSFAFFCLKSKRNALFPKEKYNFLMFR